MRTSISSNTPSSSSNPSIRPQSSSGSPTSEEAYYRQMQQLAQPVKPPSVAQIRAQGDVSTRIGVLWFVGVVCTILLVIGGATFFTSPDNAKDVWVIIGPILSSAVTGTIAFLTGEKSNAKS